MSDQDSSISNFSRFLYRILLPLLLVVAIAGGIFSYIFERGIILNNEMSGAYKVNRMIHETHPAEIPIFGSSRAEGNYIPDSLGIHFFNYGLTGARTDVTLFLMEQECLKKKTTPWVLVNLDLYGLGHGYGNIANYIPNADNKGIQEILGKNNRGYFSIPFICYFGQYENYLREYLNSRIQLTKFPNKGAAIEKKVLTESEFNRLVRQRKNSVDTFENNIVLRHRLFRLLSLHPDRHFVFVVAPYHNSYFEKYANPQTAEAFLNELRSYKNVHVFDYAKMPLPDSLFFNTSHLNFQGAVTFCHSLKDSLAILGIR